jgi:hypothetical protein
MGDNDMAFDEGAVENEVEVLIPGIDEIPVEEPVEIPDDYKDKTIQDLIKENQSLKGSISELSRQTVSNTELLQSVQQLGTRPVYVQPQIQQPVEEELDMKKINEDFLSDPAGYTMKLQDAALRKLRPEIQGLFNQNKALFRELAMNDPEIAEILKNHSDEVEGIVSTFSPYEQMKDRNIYKRAAKAVSANHLDEIVDRRVKEALAKTGSTSTQKPNFDEHNARKVTSKVRKVATEEDLKFIKSHPGLDARAWLRNKYGEDFNG